MKMRSIIPEVQTLRADWVADAALYVKENARVPKLEKLIRDVRSGLVPLASAETLWFAL